MFYCVFVNEFVVKIFSMGILVVGVFCYLFILGYLICREICCRDVCVIIFSNGIKIFFKKILSNDVWFIFYYYGLFCVNL